MPTPRTEASELSVAFGILGLDPLSTYPQADVDRRLDGTLSAAKYAAFRSEYRRDQTLYRRLRAIGERMAANPPLQQAKVVQWTGPFHQASTASGAKDLMVGNTPISVKAKSNVVANLSPPNMMVHLPGGTAPSTREDNWYLTTCPRELQDLYGLVRTWQPELRGLPADVEAFEESATREERRQVQEILRNASREEKRAFKERYEVLCHRVADRSASLFNENLAAAFRTPGRRAVQENLARWFFRLNAVRYILCGIDRGEEFGVVVPDLTGWLREWDLTEVIAAPDLTRGQSVVDFRVICRGKHDRSEIEAGFHAEIRWSHGRFSGAVESKLYKEFAWQDLIFFPRFC